MPLTNVQWCVSVSGGTFFLKAMIEMRREDCQGKEQWAVSSGQSRAGAGYSIELLLLTAHCPLLTVFFPFDKACCAQLTSRPIKQ
jgi:hypothetical protein